MSLENIILNKPAGRIILGDIERGMFGHAYLFCGDAKVTDKLLPLIAAAAFCRRMNKPPCLECLECQRARDGKHPDVLVYPKGESWKVEETEILMREVYTKPFERDEKIFLLTCCEKMEARVQNKLLKILEEPPKHVHFLLASTRESALLPTIQSRVKTVMVEGFTTFEIEQYLVEQGVEENVAKEVSSLSGGNLSEAEILVTEKGQNGYAFCKEVVERLNQPSDMGFYAKEGGAFKDCPEMLLGVFLQLFRDILMMKNGAADILFLPNLQNLYKKAVKQFTNRGIIEIIEKIQESIKNLQTNANYTFMLDGLFLKIIAGKV